MWSSFGAMVHERKHELTSPLDGRKLQGNPGHAKEWCHGFRSIHGQSKDQGHEYQEKSIRDMSTRRRVSGI